MNLSSMSLGLLALLCLGLMVLVGYLVKFLWQFQSQSSQQLLESTSEFLDSLASQNDQSLTTLMSYFDRQSILSQQTLLSSMNPLLHQQEVLVNRLLGRDALAVQVLDARSVAETSEASDYVPSSDFAENQRYENLMRTADEVIEFGTPEDLRQDQEDSGLYNLNP